MILTFAALAYPVPQPQWMTMQSNPGPRFGECVQVGDDVDGDGVPEVLVSSGRDAKLGLAAGYAFSGATGDVVFTVASSTDWNGLVHRIQALGDVDGDGLRDVVVFTHGGVFLHSGRTGERVSRVFGRPSHEPGDVLVVDDANGDGLRDFWMGCSEVGGGEWGRGEAVCLITVEGEVLRVIREPAPDVPGSAASSSSGFGTGLAWIDDLDGDDRADLAIGAPWRGNGTVYLISRESGALIGRAAGRDGACSMFGWPIVGLGDVDGDGRDDWAAASVQTGCGDWDGEETSYVRAISGATHDELWTIDCDDSYAAFGRAMLLWPDAPGGPRLLVGDPSGFASKSAFGLVDPRQGTVLERRPWIARPRPELRREVLGSALCWLPGEDGPSAIAVGGTVPIDDFLAYSGAIGVFELDGTPRWALAARELDGWRDPDSERTLSPPLRRTKLRRPPSGDDR